MVAASEIFADFGQGKVSHIAAEIHGDLSGIGDVAVALFGRELVHFDIINLGDFLLYDLGGDDDICRGGNDALQAFFS